MKRLFFFLTLIFLPSFIFSQAGAVNDLVATVSQNLVAISTDFTGANVMLFGTARGRGDVVITVRGPAISKTVYRKKRIGGIWVNSENRVFTNILSYYRVMSTRPFGDWLPPQVRERHQIGLDYLSLQAVNALVPELSGRSTFAGAVSEIYRDFGFYAEFEQGVVKIGDSLFRANIDIPGDVKPGTYLVEILLLKDGEVTNAQVLPIFVRKTGLTVAVDNFARKISWLYGIFSVLVAVFAGLGANWAFQRYNI